MFAASKFLMRALLCLTVIMGALSVLSPAGSKALVASGITDLGSSGWMVQSSSVATQTGTQISMPGFKAASQQ